MCGAAIGFRARELRLGKPSRFALTGYAWRGHAETVRAKRVRCSLSETKRRRTGVSRAAAPPKPSAKAGRVSASFNSQRTTAPHPIWLWFLHSIIDSAGIAQKAGWVVSLFAEGPSTGGRSRRIRFAPKAELSAVTGSQPERAVLERIGLDHDDFLIRVAVVALGGEGNVAIDAGVLLELVEIADDLFRLAADILHRFRDQVR